MVAATGSFAGEADGSGNRTYFRERICDGTRAVDQLYISERGQARFRRPDTHKEEPVRTQGI